jgi:hypothetical protein
LGENDLADALKNMHRFNARRKIRAVFQTVSSYQSRVGTVGYIAWYAGVAYEQMEQTLRKESEGFVAIEFDQWATKRQRGVASSAVAKAWSQSNLYR